MSMTTEAALSRRPAISIAPARVKPNKDDEAMRGLVEAGWLKIDRDGFGRGAENGFRRRFQERHENEAQLEEVEEESQEEDRSATRKRFIDARLHRRRQ